MKTVTAVNATSVKMIYQPAGVLITIAAENLKYAVIGTDAAQNTPQNAAIVFGQNSATHAGCAVKIYFVKKQAPKRSLFFNFFLNSSIYLC